jgi:hypothetical protein
MLSSKSHTLNANCQKFEACYQRAKPTAKSGEGDNDDLRHARQFYRDEHKGVSFAQEETWLILRACPKWDAPETIDLTGDVPGQSNEELFGHDA